MPRFQFYAYPNHVDKMNAAFLFVYGTLLQAVRHPVHQKMRGYCKKVSNAVIQGRLFDVGSYPGVIESITPQDLIKGELYLITHEQRLFNLLDDYEGCSAQHPLPHEFCRKIITVHTSAGDSIDAWGYIYCRPTQHLHHIRCGDYQQFLRSSTNRHNG